MDDTDGRRLLVVEPVVRRVIAGRVPPAAVDDLVQETLLRLAGAAQRLDGDELEAYASVSARNAVASYHRTAERRRQVEDGLIDLSEPDGPEVAVLHKEEAETMRGALAGLDPSDRSLLESHHVEETSIATLARQSARTEMAVRLSLARARAKLRVDYTLARRNAELPTSRCRPVLLALASGDRRAQHRLDADGHLRTCGACSDLVAPSTGKHRPVVGLVPIVALWWKELSAGARRAVSIGSVATAVVAVAAVGVVVSTNEEEAAVPPVTTTTPATTTTTPPSATTTTLGATTTVTGTQPPATGTVEVPGGPLASSPEGLTAEAGAPVEAEGASVMEVPADEGFWVGSDDGGRIWVQLTGATGESPMEIVAGSTVTFTGRLVGHGPEMAADAGLAPGPGADELAAQGHHIDVPLDAIRVG